MPIIQNFSVPAGDDVDLTFDIDDDTAIVLSGATIFWNAYEQIQGVPDKTKPVINKSSVSGDGIEIPASPDDIFVVSLVEADTLELLRNYYHEAKIVDANGNHTTVTIGVMTVTETEFRSSP